MSMSKFSKSLEITSSNIEPLAASSPNAPKVSVLEATDILSTQDIEKLIQEERENGIEKLEKTLNEKADASKKVFDGILASGDFSKIVTPEDMKALRKLLQQICKTAKRRPMTETTNLIKKDDTGLQEGDSFILGPILKSGCSEENPTSSSSNQDNTRAKKKIKFMTDKGTDDGEEIVFKKPRGRPPSADKNNSEFRTPMNRTRRGYNVAVVTPGPNSQKPINVLRRPNPGEMAISMSGSPLLVTNTNVPLNVPQITIPLSDGRVMTVIADEGLDPDMSFCSDIDQETKERLMVLQQILRKKAK